MRRHDLMTGSKPIQFGKPIPLYWRDGLPHVRDRQEKPRITGYPEACRLSKTCGDGCRNLSVVRPPPQIVIQEEGEENQAYSDHYDAAQQELDSEDQTRYQKDYTHQGGGSRAEVEALSSRGPSPQVSMDIPVKLSSFRSASHLGSSQPRKTKGLA